MKILFINRQEKKGGAAIAAMRLAEGLKNYYNAEIFFIVEHKQSKNENIFECKKNFIIRLIERIINKITSLLGLQYIWFPFSSKRILELTKRIQPDVISLHNIHGGYFDTALLKKLSLRAPIVWTLHDMWPILANSTYSMTDTWKSMTPHKYEKKQYPTISFQWGNYLMKRKKQIFSNLNMQLVTPSKWLNSHINSSPVTNSLSNSTIFNFTDSTDFNYTSSFEKLDISLLFSALDLTDSRKGGDLMLSILNIIDQKTISPLTVNILGSGYIKSKLFTNIQLQYHPLTKKTKETKAHYLNNTIFLHTARIDNAPLTLQEATMCGLPCITFDVGGCGEIITDNYNGFAIKPFDVELYAHQLLLLINDKQLQQTFKENALDQSKKLFSKENTLDKYYTLFKSLTI